jgi:hypothetical protein
MQKYERKNNWIMRGIKICCKHKRSLYTFTKNSSGPKAKAHYIKYCKILRKVIKETKQQHYSRLITKSNNKIKTKNIIMRKRETHTVVQVPSLVVNDEKLRIQETWPMPSIISYNNC